MEKGMGRQESKEHLDEIWQHKAAQRNTMKGRCGKGRTEQTRQQLIGCCAREERQSEAHAVCSGFCLGSGTFYFFFPSRCKIAKQSICSIGQKRECVREAVRERKGARSRKEHAA